jgi:WD40 repeat protein
MANFNYNINVECDEPATTEAFREMMMTQQSAFTFIAGESRALQDRVDDLQQQNQKLLQVVEQLKSENNQLQAGGGAAATRPYGGASYERGGGYVGGGDGYGGGGGGYGGGGGNIAPSYEPDLGYTVPGAGLAAGKMVGKFIMERRIAAHEAPVHAVTISPGSDVIATASWDATVKLYDIKCQEVVATLGDVEALEEGKMGGLYAVAFAKTMPEYLGCTSADKSIYLWNYQTGKLIARLLGHNDEVNGLDFHSSQSVMASASDDHKCIIWDFHEGITLRQLDRHTKEVYGCVFLGNENQYLLATCCFDKKVRIFDMRDKMITACLNRQNDDIIGIDFSACKRLLATGSDDGTIGLWDVGGWKLQELINTRDAGIPDNEVKRVAFSQDGAFLAAACSSQQVLVYDLQGPSAQLVAKLDGHQDCCFDCAWGTDPVRGDRILVSASHDHTCQYWRMMAG